MRKPVINKQKQDTIEQIKHKSGVQPRHVFWPAFLLINCPEAVYQAFVFMLFLGQNFGQHNVDWVGGDGADKVGENQHGQTSCETCFYDIVVMLVENRLHVTHGVIVTSVSALPHEISYLGHSVPQDRPMLDIGRQIISPQDNTPKDKITCPQRHETQVSIACD